MKGIKIGIKEGIVMFIALIVIMNFIGFFYAGIIILILLGVNAYLRNDEKKLKAENDQSDQTRQ